MVTVERVKTGQDGRESGFRLANLPIVAVNYTTRDKDGYVTAVDYSSLFKRLEQDTSKDDILKNARSTHQILSLFGHPETVVPFQVEHLNVIWDVTFHLTDKGKFESDGNVKQFDSEKELLEMAKRRGRSREVMLQHIEGGRNFLSEFIAHNRES